MLDLVTPSYRYDVSRKNLLNRNSKTKNNNLTLQINVTIYEKKSLNRDTIVQKRRKNGLINVKLGCFLGGH